MGKKVIFLDIDGVLNKHEWMLHKTPWLEDSKLKLLGKLCKETNAKVVLASNWRNVWFEPMFCNNNTTAIYWGHKLFSENGIDVIGITDTFGARGEEIKKYLSDNTDITNYVSIDDTLVDVKNFVKTDPEIGFTESDFEKAKSILEID